MLSSQQRGASTCHQQPRHRGLGAVGTVPVHRQATVGDFAAPRTLPDAVNALTHPGTLSEPRVPPYLPPPPSRDSSPPP
uniref:Uncharacterized protein n=1 Tax=Mycena chlorophos TaxID=658473 RepID=A0ABQ0LFN4_MYCCL|nr:predicted protein [Mycena chlorophos]